jgi:hypothetical protein
MNFKQKLQAGKFVLTREMELPFGMNCTNFKEKILKLKGNVAAIIVTDQQSAMLKANSMVGCRHRNRIALQPDIISTSIFGIENALILTSDYITLSDHPEAKAVFDLDSVQLLQVANNLNNSIAMNEKEMHLCDEKIMAKLFAANTLLGKDEYCKDYLKAKRSGRLECVSN